MCKWQIKMILILILMLVDMEGPPGATKRREGYFLKVIHYSYKLFIENCNQ